jgi:hypothetical protein
MRRVEQSKRPQISRSMAMLSALIALVSMPALSSPLRAQDGRTTVTYGSLYQTSSIKIAPYDLTTLLALPAGYAALNNKAHLITTCSQQGSTENPKRADIPLDTGTKSRLRYQRTAPSVIIEKPDMDALFVGPAAITIQARATDRDGTIKEVRFLDNGEPIGSGRSTDGERFAITEENVSFGPHSLLAIAVDNEGLQATSNAANVFVNGNAKVVIKTPTKNSLIEPGTDILVVANATDPSGICKVQFYFTEQLLGEGSRTGPDEYSLSIPNAWRARYKIEAVVTDSAGIKTLSSPVRFVASRKPIINLEAPTKDYRVAGTNVGISAVASQVDGDIQRVDFFANDELLGSTNEIGTGHFHFTWRNVPGGTYSLTAVAIDELGVTAKSSPVRIIVEMKRGKRSINSIQR